MNEGRYEAGDHPLLHAKLHELAHMMRDRLPLHFGFTLLVFDTYDDRKKDKGSMFYASTATRQENVSVISEFIETLQKHEKEDREKVAIPPHACTCKYVMDASKTLHDDSRPAENAVSICAGCGKIWLFNADMTMREPTEVELQLMRSEKIWDDVVKAREMIKDFRDGNPFI